MAENTSVPHEVRVEEQNHMLEQAIAFKKHESVAHARINPLGFLEAAEVALEENHPVHALYLIGVAEGAAEALRSVAGLQGIREGAMAQKIARRAAEIRLQVENIHL